MPTTTKGIRYPQNADAVDVAGDIQNLASDADSLIGTVQALTTKGDLLTRNASNETRLAVGTNNYALTADSSEATGLKWAAVSASSGGYEPIVTSTVSNATTSRVTMSSIPATFTDLRLVINYAQSATTYSSINVQFNGYTTSVYTWHYTRLAMGNTPTSTVGYDGATGATGDSYLGAGNGSAFNAPYKSNHAVIDWLNYTETSHRQGYLHSGIDSFYQSPSNTFGFNCSNISEVINRIDLYTGAGSNYIGQNTTMTLYGIKRYGL